MRRHHMAHHTRVGLQVEIIGVDHFANYALERFTDVCRLLRPKIVNRHVDERRVGMNDVIRRTCNRDLFMNCSL